MYAWSDGVGVVSRQAIIIRLTHEVKIKVKIRPCRLLPNAHGTSPEGRQKLAR
jgi:hypothetical protein